VAIRILVDPVVLYNFWRCGLPIVATGCTVSDWGEEAFKVTRLAVSNQDPAALSCPILLDALLILVVWRMRKKSCGTNRAEISGTGREIGVDAGLTPPSCGANNPSS